MYTDASMEEIDLVLQQAWTAFKAFKKTLLQQRAAFMKAIAAGLEQSGDPLIETAMAETNLPEARLKNERGRTIFQLNSYADACERGEWLEARIDTAMPDRIPPRPDIRKMMEPLGPVVVFGSSNFPFAFSTAGGDTASALAAGCPVIVKAHPGHAQTSTMVAAIILAAAEETRMPPHVFSHVYGASFDVGKARVTHPLTKAVAFTGSYAGGKQLFDWGNQRKEPIPVFAEMGSINPVFLMPGKLKAEAAAVAKMYAASVTLGVGQFCTNPGLIVGMEGEDLKTFTEALANEVNDVKPGKMLHAGIAKSYNVNREKALQQENVSILSAPPAEQVDALCGIPAIATTSAKTFLANNVLHQEVFGPYSLVVNCSTIEEMILVAEHLEGQLTATIMATETELGGCESLIEAVKGICGRLILNNVPTGVEVCLAMHHGGPFPATTDSRFTSVGADAIKRFIRPLSFQNWPDNLLPDALKNNNPLGIFRTVNIQLTKAAVH
jgi:NADP-dependent aldehyde dehydrogenase